MCVYQSIYSPGECSVRLHHVRIQFSARKKLCVKIKLALILLSCQVDGDVLANTFLLTV